ncbi:MAG: Zn-dependent protease [halophilic archaeon J07HX64]|jgi:Zn-dependent proteases|nr:MAG: Zn-dependent protease [halophilic archaeon J07HX64]
MKGNYTLFSIWGIPIRINVSLLVFLPILAWLVGTGEQLAAYGSLINLLPTANVDPGVLADTERWLIGASAALGLFTSVTVHELGHAWVAMRYDIGTESITLWILGGLASLSEIPRQWDREFYIAVAGPVSSLFLAALCVGAFVVLPAELTVVSFVMGFLAVMNIVLAVFNMIPAFPMDGGRVLRALLGRNRSYASATRIAARVGRGFALLFAIVGVVVVFSPVLLLLALFIYVAATRESRSVVVGERLSGLSVADILSESPTVDADDSAAAVFDRVVGAHRTDVAVAENGRIIGVVTGEQLQELPFEEFETTTAGALATTDLPRFDARSSAADALTGLTRSRADAALVERDGSTVGVVSRNDFSTVLESRRETSAL